MLDQTTTFQDQLTGLRVEQQTNQDFFRLYLGGRLGPHGHGFFRPHVGAHLALVHYGISTDVVVPDDVNRENEIRQNLRDEGEWGTGWDVSLGSDLNFSDRVAVEGGVRFLKSFGVPQQLGAGSVEVSPGYLEIYFGVGLGFGAGRSSEAP